jgi:hypothetical protein
MADERAGRHRPVHASLPPYRDDDDSGSDVHISPASQPGSQDDMQAEAPHFERLDRAAKAHAKGQAASSADVPRVDAEADDAPGLEVARNDALFVRMADYLLDATTAIQADTNLVVTQDAFDALQEWAWEHLWLPRQGFVDDEDNPDMRAVRFQERQ